MENKPQQPTWAISEPQYFNDLTLSNTWVRNLSQCTTFLRNHVGQQVPYNAFPQDSVSLMIAWGIPPIGPLSKQLPPDLDHLDRLLDVVLLGLIPHSHLRTPPTPSALHPTPTPTHSPLKPNIPPWAYKQLHRLIDENHIFGYQAKPRNYGLKVATWFYEHNFTRPHPLTHQQRYYCEANMWLIADHLAIPRNPFSSKVRTLENYGFIRRLTVASNTGKYAINTWQIAHTPALRLSFYHRVLKGDVILPPR